MSILQAWIIDTLEKAGGTCTYGQLVEVGEEHHCDTVGSMIKYLKNKKVITFGPGYLMFPMHQAEDVTLLDAGILGDLTESLAAAKAFKEGHGAGSAAAEPAAAAAAAAPAAAADVDGATDALAAAALESAAEPDAAGNFPLAQLQSPPFPAGVEKTKRETYLADEEFEQLFGMDKAAFAALPGWKRNAAKKKHKLF